MSEVTENSLIDGRYRVVRLLGKGERKQTYLARDTKAKRDVAIAFMTSDADPQATEQEVEMLGRPSHHPYIVTLYESEPPRYLVFEYLPGGELRDYCQKLQSQGKQMPLPEFFRLARQLCRALAHIHEHGIIHRDVSMSNIWLDERGNAHLGDFDTAISVDDPDPASVSTTLEGYPAPELLSGNAVDVRADLYSVGAVLYEALVGASPSAPPPITPPSRLRNDLPAGLERLILSMLSPEREHRPPNANAILEELRAIQSRTSDVEILIANEESSSVEFKASLRTDVPGGTTNKELEKVVIKSVAGFLNGQGGTLIIGVADDGTILGLESDYSSSSNIVDRDGFERHLRGLLSKTWGKPIQAFVTVNFHEVEGRDICRVAVEPSDHPAYVKEEGRTKLFLRTGNATNELTIFNFGS
jgi:serine/threonine protein kinase